MSWLKAIDTSLEFWQDVIPDLTSICISRDLESLAPGLDSSIKSDDLYPEPRSIHSSEFSEKSNEKKSGVWTAEEDKTLISTAESNNFKWEEVAKNFPNTSPRSVEQRWKTLNENKQKIDWTQEQDRLIYKLYQTHGGQWKKISTFFPGISSSAIKNRFYGSIKRKMSGSPKSADERTSDGKFEMDTRPLSELSEAEKRNQIQKLYQKLFEIQNHIDTAKTQIINLASKNKKAGEADSPRAVQS